MKPAMWWPLAIVAVLGVTVAANAFLLVEASDPNGGAIEPDYYRKAVAWDSTRAEEARSRALGWKIDATLEPEPRGARVTVRLTDAGNAPVEGAIVTLAAIHNRAGGRFVDGTLAARGPGIYAAMLPLRHFGQWELRLDARRGAEHFVAKLHRELERTTEPAP